MSENTALSEDVIEQLAVVPQLKALDTVEEVSLDDD